MNVGGPAASRNVHHGAAVPMIETCENLSPAAYPWREGPLLDAWFELNYRLQEESSDSQVNKSFVEQWMLRLWTIVAPRPQCFWLFLARINELALLCASRYVDCCEFPAADGFLLEPCRVFLRIDGGRITACMGREGIGGMGGECVPAEAQTGPLLPCLYNLLSGSGHMSENYLLSISYRTYKIRQVARMLMGLGMGNTEQMALKLSGMDLDDRRDLQSRLCLFERKTFNEIGRALHLYMRNGNVDDEYVGKYLRG